MTEKETSTEDELEDRGPSKSQRKRDMQSLRDLGEKLLLLPADHLEQIPEPAIVIAVQECKKITKGNARKRQLQYIGKLLSKTDLTDVQDMIDRFDASTRTHVTQFHKLEQWREKLISGDNSVLDDISSKFPGVDRQHLRQLTRKATTEREKEVEPPVQFRKLFQYLKSLELE
ncbi:MAG: ribosome-associated protein [Candidatus Azotimanducaceae bacterium]|jgi:ribosome-associated protein